MTDAPEFAREETRAGQADAVHMHDELAQPAKRRSSGSANRQRQAAVCVRLLPEQLAQLADAADAARMSVPAYLLAGRLGEGHPAPRRRQRRASADAAALMRALVAFHRANNNLNQLAHRQHVGVAYRATWRRPFARRGAGAAPRGRSSAR
jgi:hypothetical protein